MCFRLTGGQFFRPSPFARGRKSITWTVPGGGGCPPWTVGGSHPPPVPSYSTLVRTSQLTSRINILSWHSGQYSFLAVGVHCDPSSCPVPGTPSFGAGGGAFRRQVCSFWVVRWGSLTAPSSRMSLLACSRPFGMEAIAACFFLPTSFDGSPSTVVIPRSGSGLCCHRFANRIGHTAGRSHICECRTLPIKSRKCNHEGQPTGEIFGRSFDSPNNSSPKVPVPLSA